MKTQGGFAKDRKTGRLKDLAPNGIKKSPPSTATKKRGSSRRASTRTSPRKTSKQLLTSAKKEQRQKKVVCTGTTPKKAIRGNALYRFTESARTLRSAVANTNKTTELETPRKNQSQASVPMLPQSKRITKTSQPTARGQQTIPDYVIVKKSSAKRVCFSTPKKGKTFRQARLSVSGRKFKINEIADMASEASAKTAATLRKNGRKVKKPADKSGSFSKKTKRQAKKNATTSIKQLYSHSKRHERSQNKGDSIFQAW